MVTRRQARFPGTVDESGMSLAELLVSSAILAVVMPLACALLVSGAQAQRDMSAVAEATTTAQVAVASVEAGVRNASDLRRTTSGTGNLDELLVARTTAGAVDSAAWTCRAWFYSADRRALYTRTVSVTATTAPITSPSGADLSTWTVLAERVSPASSAGMLAPSPDRTRVDLAFSVGTGTATKPALVSTTIVRRPQGLVQGAPCF